MRFYKASTNTGTHTGTLWSSTGAVLATGTFSGETSSGCQTLTFSSPVSVTAGTTYTASYLAPNGHYSADGGYFPSSVTNGALTAPSTGGNGVYAYGNGGTAPTNAYQATNYWVDVLFVTSVVPTVTATTPTSGATGVDTGTGVSATFSVPMTASSIQMSVTPSGGSAVAGTVSYNSATSTATFTPAAALAASTTYAARVSAATSTTGTAMAALVSWTFTTGTGSCPCSLFAPGSTPATIDSGDGTSLELGVNFTPSRAGTVTGVKFYKATANTGAHTGSLWSSSGTRLATGTFSGETSSGCQTLTFRSPVSVTAGTTSTVPYLAPNGHYSVSPNYFTSAVTLGPLSAPSSTNGVYRYGSGGTVPSSTYVASNYWVDVIFS